MIFITVLMAIASNFSYSAIELPSGKVVVTGVLEKCEESFCIRVSPSSTSERVLQIKSEKWKNLGQAVGLPLQLHGILRGDHISLKQAPKLVRFQKKNVLHGWSFVQKVD